MDGIKRKREIEEQYFSRVTKSGTLQMGMHTEVLVVLEWHPRRYCDLFGTRIASGLSEALISDHPERVFHKLSLARMLERLI